MNETHVLTSEHSHKTTLTAYTPNSISSEQRNQLVAWMARETPQVSPNQVWRVEIRKSGASLEAVFFRFALSAAGKKFLDHATGQAACLAALTVPVSCVPFPEAGGAIVHG